MSEHKATITWARHGVDFGYKTYPRDHVWRFENGVEVPASAAPAYPPAARDLYSRAKLVIIPIRSRSIASLRLETGLVFSCEERPNHFMRNTYASSVSKSRSAASALSRMYWASLF